MSNSEENVGMFVCSYFVCFYYYYCLFKLIRKISYINVIQNILVNISAAVVFTRFEVEKMPALTFGICDL